MNKPNIVNINKMTQLCHSNESRQMTRQKKQKTLDSKYCFELQCMLTVMMRKTVQIMYKAH